MRQKSLLLMPYKKEGDLITFSVVWSMPKRWLGYKSQDELLPELSKFERKLACSIEPITEIYLSLYSPIILKNIVIDGICAIADSAHSIHPLAGQGINLGIG